MGILDPNRSFGSRKNSESLRERNKSIPQTRPRSLPSHKRHVTRKRKGISPGRRAKKESNSIHSLQQKSRTPTWSNQKLRRKVPNKSCTKNPQRNLSCRGKRRKQRYRHRSIARFPRSRISGHKTQTLHSTSTRTSITQDRNTYTRRNCSPGKAITGTRTRRNSLT